MTRNNDQATALARRNPGVIAPWSPMEELTSLRRQMDDLFTRSFGYTPLAQLIPADAMHFEPPCEIANLDNKVQIHAAVPGFKAEEIQIEATADRVTITGERKALTTEMGVESERGWLTRESRFTLICDLPAEIDPSKSKAIVQDGMLSLDLPKTERAKAKTVKIAVGQK